MSSKILVGLVAMFAHMNMVVTESWKNELMLDPNGDYQLFLDWNDVNMTFEVHVRTKGYVGFGFSPKGDMKGADIAIGWVKDSQVFFHDRYATENAEPLIDESQDYELLAAYENDTHTVLRFRRTLDTCDDHDIDITNDTMRFIYAWRDEDPQAETGLEYHGPVNRGTRALKISYIGPKPTTFNFTNDVYAWDLQMPKVNIAPVLTSYVCKYFKFPAYPNKRHRVGWEILADPNNHNLLHHFVLFHCNKKITLLYGNNPADHYGDKCSAHCIEYILISSVGQMGAILPPDMGAIIGEVGQETHYMLNLHYNNPGQLKGLVDQTTVRFYLTEKLREHESGFFTLTLGMTDLTTIIPPRQPSFIVIVSCPPECTKQLFPKGANLTSFTFHGHKALRKGKVRHFRNGIELPPMFEENDWDFEQQVPTILADPVKILPGDYILGECEYDTTDRSSLTLGGLQSTDEMCMIYMEYYPAVDATECRKSGPYKELYQIFHVEEHVNINDTSTVINMALYNYLLNYDASTLTENDVSNIRRIQGHDTIQVDCRYQTGELYNYAAEYPNSSTVFYQAPKKNCTNPK